jgi:hypothetical protein
MRHPLRSFACALFAWAATAGCAAEEAAAPNARFESLARKAPRGDYPKYFLGEQSYFTVVGRDGGGHEGLLNEEGALEADKGDFSIEPFLYAKGGLATWNDAARSQELEQGYLPVPSVVWRWRSLRLKVTAFAAEQGEERLYARYRVENAGPEREQARLLLAIRPFQVNPPWQSLNTTGGVAPIRDIALVGPGVRVNGALRVIPLTPPDRFGALASGQGSLAVALRTDQPLPAAASDPQGYASGALEFRLDLPPGAAKEVYVAVRPRLPGDWAEAARLGRGLEAYAQDRLRETLDHWQARLARVEFLGPPEARKLADAARSNLAYIFVNQDGAALQPGSRTYERSWIRDSAVIASALLGQGYADEPRRFVEWYAGFQFPDGKVPCCVDGRGADPTPENDSHGEFVYAVAEYYRHTRDLNWVRTLWPRVVKAVEAIDALRRQRMTAEYQAPAQRLFFGMMPDSISHEGYAAHPVHSFWDGFWTLRGLKDAAELAALLGDQAHAAEFAALRDAFRKDLYASLEGTMAQHRIAFLPGSVELGDFDSNALAMIVNIGGEQQSLPQDALRRSFDEYWAYFQKRRDGRLEWDAYTPYEVRTVEALVRLGRRAQAHELLGYLLTGQRPPAWNHWAEVVWRDPKAPKFIGDMPHAWIGAEFVRAVRSLYAYERDGDRALVLAAGIPESWLDSGAGVERLPTWFGALSYSLRREGPDALRLKLSGALAMPPGGIVVQPPGQRPLREVVVNGKPGAASAADEAVIREVPAEVLLKYGP